MVLPSEVKTRAKIRDAGIINAWMDGQTQESLALQHGITRIAIYQILRKNRELLKLDKDFEKAKRIHLLKQRLANAAPTEKDELEILSALKEELEPKGAAVQVTNNSYVLYRNADAVRDEKQNSAIQTR